MQKSACTLHSHPLTLFCNRCLEPICQKCTLLGPHNTPIHSLTPLPQSYQRRVQQISQRLSSLSQTRQHALCKIIQLNKSIEGIKIQGKRIDIETDKFRVQIQKRLEKQFGKIIAMLEVEEEGIRAKLNGVNDLGNQVEGWGRVGLAGQAGEAERVEGEFGQVGDIQCLIHFQRVMGDMREIVDQLNIILDKEIKTIEMPKQLSQIRIKLSQIETYEQLYKSKVKILQSLIKKLSSQISKISKPQIPYVSMLEEINKFLFRFSKPSPQVLQKPQVGHQKQKSSMHQVQKISHIQYQQFSTSLDRPSLHKIHNVCHFCGIIMDDHSINTGCAKNQISQQIKGVENYYGTSASKATNTSNNSTVGAMVSNLANVNLSGFCKKVPEVVRFGTHRHYFAEPQDPILFFRIAFLTKIIRSQTLSTLEPSLPLLDSTLLSLNLSPSSSSCSNSLSSHLSLLLLKIKTLSKIHNKNISSLLKKQALAQKNSYCSVISFKYFLMEIIGLTEGECDVIVGICQIGDKRGKGQVNFAVFVQVIDAIKI